MQCSGIELKAQKRLTNVVESIRSIHGTVYKVNKQREARGNFELYWVLGNNYKSKTLFQYSVHFQRCPESFIEVARVVFYIYFLFQVFHLKYEYGAIL